MRFGKLAWIAAGLFFLSGCESTDAPAPPGIEGPLYDLSSAAMRAQADYVEANRALFQSLDTFTPYMKQVLLANPSGLPNRLSGFLAGRTYAFEDAAYAESGTSGAPGDGVRFLLYDVTASGAPILERARGYVEVRATASTTPVFMTVRIVRDSVLVMGLDARGESTAQLTWTGDLATPSGASSLAWGGDVLGDQHTFHAQLPDDVRILYSVLGEGATPENVLVQAFRGAGTPDWELYADIVAEPDGNIMEGPVRVATESGAHLAACISGTLEMPVFQSAAAGDCVYYGLAPIDLSPSELNALEASYLVLRNLYLVSRGLLETGMTGLGS